MEEEEEMETREAEADKQREKDDFPMGLRVLAVDDDMVCLRLLEVLLQECGYEVTVTQHARTALQLLRENKDKYDIVISDVHMPDMDGFKLLEIVGLEMDLPVIMLSVSSDVGTVMKGIKHGACDYLVKPVRIEELKLIWKHVVKKSLHDTKEANDSSGKPNHATKSEDDRTTKLTRKKENETDSYSEEDTSIPKKPRVTWNHDLHNKFINAVNQLGIDRAVPKKILEYMDAPGITRENVASHLQKYRKALRKNSTGMNQQGYGDGSVLDGFSENPPKPMVFSFDGRASDNRYSLEKFRVNGYRYHPNTSPFNYTQGPHTTHPWTLLPAVHRDNLCQPYAATSQLGNRRMQHLGHGSNPSEMETTNPQSKFNELSNQSIMRRPNQFDGSAVNASQRVWASGRELGMTSVPQLGNAVKENPIDVLFDNTNSLNGDPKDSFSAELNGFLTLPNENHNYRPCTGADLDWGTQRNGDSFEMQSCKGEHIRVTGHSEYGKYPVEQSPTGTMFHLNKCDSEDDLHSVLKQFQQ